MKVAVVGATGLVGTRMLEVLAERDFPVTELLPVASSRSVGRKVSFKGREWTVVSAEDAIAARPDLALFSAGAGASRELAPKFAEVGCRVVDNSSCWRMDPSKKLVVPEINGDAITADDYIIANPNCSTIQAVVVLYPLHKAAGLKYINISTYQSVAGTGKAAIESLRDGSKAALAGEGYDEKVYPHGIAFNLLPLYPLDGGRALDLLVSWAAGPEAGERAARWSAVVTAAGVCAAAVSVMWSTGGSLWLLPAAAGAVGYGAAELRQGHFVK